MTNKPQTLEELRMDIGLQEQRAREQEAWELFCAENPQYHYDANLSILRAFHHGEEVTLQSINESLPFLKDRFARKDQIKLEEDIIETEQGQNKRLSGLSKAELRSIAYQERGATPLPEKYTAEIIRELPAQELRKLLHKFGEKMVNLRLRSRQGVE